ncbi:Cell division protein kinase 1 [Conglomerata obtusa]
MGLPNYDCAIDIWAIGLVFIELLIGKPLFKGESDKDQLDKILSLIKDDFKYHETNLEENNVIGIVKYLELLKVPDDLIQVFAKCIVISPSSRMSAHQLLGLQYFKT